MCPKAEPFALAGVYDVWKGDGGKAINEVGLTPAGEDQPSTEPPSRVA
jgi:hypothetical protein